jgi:hypothetical protein
MRAFELEVRFYTLHYQFDYYNYIKCVINMINTNKTERLNFIIGVLFVSR